jgi:hypothetical protein
MEAIGWRVVVDYGAAACYTGTILSVRAAASQARRPCGGGVARHDRDAAGRDGAPTRHRTRRRQLPAALDGCEVLVRYDGWDRNADEWRRADDILSVVAVAPPSVTATAPASSEATTPTAAPCPPLAAAVDAAWRCSSAELPAHLLSIATALHAHGGSVVDALRAVEAQSPHLADRFSILVLQHILWSRRVELLPLVRRGRCGRLCCRATCCPAACIVNERCCCAVLCCAVLCCAVLCCAVLCCAVLCCAVLL